MTREFEDGAIYSGVISLFKAASDKGLIYIELPDVVIESAEDLAVPASSLKILDLNGWIDFLKDINAKSTNGSELSFVNLMLKTFEALQGEMDKDLINEIRKIDTVENFLEKFFPE